jgi:hypothetical protein
VQVRAFPSQPGARRSATAHAKTTKSPRNNKQSMTGAPGRGRVDARAREVFRCRARRRTRPKHEASVETRRARSRCRARGVAGRAPFARTRDNPNRSGIRKARLTGGRPVNAPRADRARRSRTVVFFPERFFFTPPQTPLLGPRLSSVSVSRRARAHRLAPLCRLDTVQKQNRWARSCGSARR